MRVLLNILFWISIPVFGQIKVVTTTTDLKYIADEIGKEKISSQALIRGFDDPHYVLTRPDFLVKLNTADVFCEIGLDLEIGWSPLLLQQSRNSKIQKGRDGYCDASSGVKILGRPTTKVDRSMGDMHIYGNPHYWLDPVNAIQISVTILETLQRVDTENSEFYKKNQEIFKKKMVQLVKEEMRSFQPYFGSKVAVFHSEFAYLANRFKFNADLSLEERPGIPPSNHYLETVIKKMKSSGIKVILISPVNNPKYAEFVSSHIPGSIIVTMPTSVGSMKDINTYQDSIHNMLSNLKSALQKTGSNQ
ncbi:MAG: metal ABC transporter substrate-binding protein [Leptospiraceae bacterium]|nr:metal ABC transporter substrate-binding protein [Leptospiraceae bacterium]